MARPLLHALILAAPLLLPACAPPASRGGFESGNPSARFYAIEQAVRQQDLAATVQITASLDSDDPVERLLAIEALERLTGETLGYRHDAPRHERDEAVRRWILRNQRESAPYE